MKKESICISCGELRLCCKGLCSTCYGRKWREAVKSQENLLTFVSITGHKKHGQATAIYRCSCGLEKEIIIRLVDRNLVRSCGHLAGKANITHGATVNGEMIPEYRAWVGMKTRCYNKNSKDYQNYGGRGIKVCDRWLESFSNFLRDMGNRPSLDHSIDSIDVDGDYGPHNCRWSLPMEQNANRRKCTITAKELQDLRYKLQCYEELFGPLGSYATAPL